MPAQARPLVTVAALALILGLGGACGGDSKPVCNGASGAQLCLDGKGDAYEMRASGFQPGSQIFIAADGQGDRAIAVEPDGSIAKGGVIGVLGEDGPERPKRVTVHGISQDGTPVTFDVVP